MVHTNDRIDMYKKQGRFLGANLKWIRRTRLIGMIGRLRNEVDGVCVETFTINFKTI